MATDLNTRIMAALSEAVRATRFLPFVEMERRLHDIAADCEVDVRDIVRTEVPEVRFGNVASSEPVQMCEAGCGPATTACSEGTPLCDNCAWGLDREVLDEIAQLVGFDRAVHDDLVAVVKAKLTPLATAVAVTDHVWIVREERGLILGAGRTYYSALKDARDGGLLLSSTETSLAEAAESGEQHVTVRGTTLALEALAALTAAREVQP